MGLDFLVPIFGILVVLVPITGLTAVLTLKYGGKPFLETLARELRGAGGMHAPGLEHRIEELTEQVDALTSEVERLREAQRFDEKLLEPGRGGPAR
jgi:hypothetical protein